MTIDEKAKNAARSVLLRSADLCCYNDGALISALEAYESAKEPDALGGVPVVGIEETVDAICNGHAAWDRGGSPNTLGWHVRQALRPVFNKLHEEEERGNYWKAQAFEHLDTIEKIQGDIDKSAILHIHGKAAKEPVSLERCAIALCEEGKTTLSNSWIEKSSQQKEAYRAQVRDVLTAAGVKYKEGV